MARFSHFLILALLGVVIASAEPDASPDQPGIERPGDFNALQALLQEVPVKSLHDALHESLDLKYNHGVFADDRTALEAVHRSNADAATSIVNKAKRQAAENSTTTTTAPPILPPVTSTSTSIIPPPSSSTPVPSTSSTSTSTTKPVVSSTTSTVVPVKSTSSTISSSTSSSVVVSSRSTSSSIASSSTVYSSSTSQSASSSSTPTTSASSLTTLISTSTLPNGGRSTVTAVTVVNPASMQAQSGQAGTPTGTSTPGLQSGAAVPQLNIAGNMQAVMGGVVLGLLAL